MRRRWVTAIGMLSAALVVGAPATADTSACPRIGAIRWDAWFGDKGVPGQAVQKSLGPRRWRDRLPTCAKVIDEQRVQIACDGAAQMKEEIRLAAEARVAFWAFVSYPDSSPMSLGLQSYLRAANRELISFALLTELDKWGDSNSYRPKIERFARLLREPTYLHTTDGRPVLFLGFVTDAAIQQRFGGIEGLRRVLDEFRALTSADGSASPFVVLLSSDLKRAPDWMRTLGLDALSSYAIADNESVAAPYSKLAAMAESFWDAVEQRALPLVPIVMSGWDRRPRVQNPVPWERGQYSEEQMQRWFHRPTPKELQAHAEAALRRSRKHPDGPGLVLAYAWNEFDEGGWLAPTRGDGRSRLDAMRSAVDSVCSGPLIPPR